MKQQNRELSLAKTHDFVASGQPKLTVVMIHGLASDSSTYNKALNFLEKADSLRGVRFVTFDLLGVGQSPRDNDLNYDYKEYLEALHNSIKELGLDTPLVLVGHSLGTFIATRYTRKYEKSVKSLILISPPVYTPEDLANPAFAAGMKLFEEGVSVRNPGILKEKSFRNAIDNIVMNKSNYNTLATLETPATLIYGDKDQFIASQNIPDVLKVNKNLTAIQTSGRHGVTEDKYVEVKRILEGLVDD